MLVDKQHRELLDLNLENERSSEKAQDLEKLVLMLSNNVYAQGDPEAYHQLQVGLSTIEELRAEKFNLKKTVLYERKK